MRVYDGMKRTFEVRHILEVEVTSEVLHSCRPDLSAPEVALEIWLVACASAVMVPMCQGLVPGMAHVHSPSELMLEPS